MKIQKKIVLMCYVFSFSILYSQEESENKIEGNYYFTKTLSKELTQQTKNNTEKTKVVQKAGYKVEVIKTNNSIVYYTYWNFNPKITETIIINSNDVKYRYYENFKNNKDTIVFIMKKKKVKIQKIDSINCRAYNSQIFIMPKMEFEANTHKYYSSYKGVKFGIYTIPFRLRGVFHGKNSNGDNTPLILNPH